MQILVQLGYPSGGALVAAAPTLGCMYFALPFIPAFLDHKANTTAESFQDDYFEAESSPAVKEGTLPEVEPEGNA
jgi:hypothetical protein